MSRVGDAMRRATDDDGGSALEPQLSVDTMADVRELAEESYPIELPERRPARHVAPVAAAHIAVEPAPPVAPEPAVNEARSLFERIDATLAQKIVVDTHMPPAWREQYRRLAAVLHHAQASSGLKVVMIASAVPGEGKTLTASNLALTFSESYKRSVLLIDADLRRPALHHVFGVDNVAGLMDGLSAVRETKMQVRQLSSHLALLPAGRASSDPMAGLTSERMRGVINEAREVFDWVIVDTPPVVLLPDAHLLGSMVDGAIVVIKAGSTAYDLVKRAIEALGRDRILGTVLNRAEAGAHATGYGYYNHYYAREAGAATDPV
jgi:capsular exopolysaccharide synthesis family protein